MRERDQERALDVLFLRLWRVLDESVIRSDSSDNEKNEEDLAQVASVMNNLIFFNNIAFHFLM